MNLRWRSRAAFYRAKVMGDPVRPGNSKVRPEGYPRSLLLLMKKKKEIAIFFGGTFVLPSRTSTF